jgi:hypothetical protein
MRRAAVRCLRRAAVRCLRRATVRCGRRLAVPKVPAVVSVPVVSEGLAVAVPEMAARQVSEVPAVSPVVEMLVASPVSAVSEMPAVVAVPEV